MSRIWFTNARLFTAVDETVLDDAGVLIDGDRIEWSGPMAAAPSVQDAVLHSLMLAITLEMKAGIGTLFAALRFPITVERQAEFGALPIVVITGPLTTRLPEDPVIIDSTEISGTTDFEEIVVEDALDRRAHLGPDAVARHRHHGPLRHGRLLVPSSRRDGPAEAVAELGQGQLRARLEQRRAQLLDRLRPPGEGWRVAAISFRPGHGLHAVNPSGFVPQLEPADCKGCSRCSRACPVTAITMTARRREHDRKNELAPVIDPQRCIGCGVCAQICPNDAIVPVSTGTPELRAPTLRNRHDLLPEAH